MTDISRRLLTIGTGLALAATSVPEALALDGYWHGVRSEFWHDGVSGIASNWYTAPPPSGTAQDAPNDTAMFAPGASRKKVTVQGNQSIQTIIYTAGNDKYITTVKAGSSLSINGLGMTNGSSVKQDIVVDGTDSNLIFSNNAVACIKPGTTLAFYNENRGVISFRNKTYGNNSCEIFNRKNSTLKFTNNSSAGNMFIANSSISKNKFGVKFLNNSTGGNAKIYNIDGVILFRTFGPDGDYKITIGDIYNVGIIDLGINRLSVSKDVYLRDESSLKVSFNDKNKFGRIRANDKIRLSGYLTIKGSKKARPGKYTIMKSDNKRVGKFYAVQFKGFNSSLKEKIVYTKNAVQLVLSKK